MCGEQSIVVASIPGKATIVAATRDKQSSPNTRAGSSPVVRIIPVDYGTTNPMVYLGNGDPAGVALDAAGNVFGVSNGVSQYPGGFVLELAAPNWNPSVLYGFTGNRIRHRNLQPTLTLSWREQSRQVVGKNSAGKIWVDVFSRRYQGKSIPVLAKSEPLKSAREAYFGQALCVA